MSEESRKNSGRKRMGSRRIAGMVMVALAVVLIVTAVVGYSLQRSRQTAENLAQLRTDAVLHAASEGLVDKIANDARDAKLKELRARKDFRSMGLNEVNGICDEASANARAEAEAMYSNPEVADRPALEAAVNGLESRLADSGSLRKAERAAYSQLYVSLVENVAEWTELTGKAGEDDEQLFGLLCGIVPGLNAPENQHMKAGFIRLARQKAEAEPQLPGSDAADAVQRVEGVQGLGAVGHTDRDPVSLADAQGDQRPGGALDPGHKPGVAGLLAHKLVGSQIRVGLGSVPDDLVDGLLGIIQMRRQITVELQPRRLRGKAHS